MSKGLFKAASFIAFITILSKLVGFIRDLVIANCYGASIESDAFFYAYQVPSFFLILLGGLNGPFHTATIAYFSKLKTDTLLSDAQVNRQINKFITHTFLFSFLVAILLFLFADQISDKLAFDASNNLKEMIANQLRWMTPIIVVGSLVGIFFGLLSMHGVFFTPSISPTIISITVIIAVLGWGDLYGGVCLAIGSLIGGIIQLIMQLPGYYKLQYKFYPVMSDSTMSLKGLAEFLFPAMIGTTIGQVNVFVDMFFVSGLPEGSWTAIGYANRLIQLVLGVLLTALLIPIFPIFTKLVADNKREDLQYYFQLSIKSIWFIAFPIVTFILVFGGDTVRLLLERGSFNAQDTLLVTTAMFYLAFSIIPYLARDVMTRLFYAYNDSKTPLYCGLAAIIVNILADWILVKHLGIGGITLSTTIVTLFSLSLLSFFIVRYNPDLSLAHFSKTFGILLVASGAAAMISFYLHDSLQRFIPSTLWIQGLYLGCIFAVIAFIYSSIVLLWDKDYKEILGRLLSRFLPR